MLERLMPRDEQFFDLFNQLAGNLAASAKLLNDLFKEPHRATDLVKSIKDVEHAADLLTAQIIQRINKSFVTPFDREDIHNVASSLDDVIDLLDGTARRFTMFHITEVKPAAAQLAGILLRAADEIQGAVEGMRKPKVVNQKVTSIKMLEEEGDAVYGEAVGALFVGTPDPIEVIKWKEMYDTLEGTIDSCMGVAQALQSLSLKNA
jgi:predicted phosphate transport protein (TIGR00153 family)